MSLDVQNVSIDRSGRRIVSDITLQIAPGEVVAIAGPNGSGKSTLLGAISGELKCVNGHVLIEGKSIEEWDLEALARQRAVLLQESPLSFPFNVIDVVLMGRSAHHQGIETDRDIQIADEAIRMVGLHGFEARKYTQLSGGEKQRVHLARVLSQVWHDDTAVEGRPTIDDTPINANPTTEQNLSVEQNSQRPMQPKYLILDEPTSSQDMAAQHLVLSSARTFANQGVGVLCVLHDLNQAAQYADRVLLLSEGKMASLGTPREVLTPDILGQVYGLPVRVLDHEDYPYPIVLSHPNQHKAVN